MSSLPLWERSQYIPTQKDYYQELDNVQRNRKDIFFVVVKANDQKPVGMIYTLNMDLINGFCFVAGIVAPEHRKQSIGTQGLVLFIDYLFAHIPIRKVYADVLEYNVASLALVKKLGFLEEGCFRNHSYYAGKYWSSYRFALYQVNLNSIQTLLQQA